MNDEDFGLVSKDIYLKKEGQESYIGLHSLGENDAEWDLITPKGLFGNKETIITPMKGFKAWESWGNEYIDGKMVGRGSFRVFNDIENVASEMELEGWVRFNPEEKKNE